MEEKTHKTLGKASRAARLSLLLRAPPPRCNPRLCLQNERRSLASFQLQMKETDAGEASGFP